MAIAFKTEVDPSPTAMERQLRQTYGNRVFYMYA